MLYLLGIDVGTTSTKTLLCDIEGRVVAEASQSYALHSPQVGWNEQEPTDWWSATINTVRELIHKQKLKPDQIKSIGLSGQMHGSVFLDGSGQVIRPALLWNDQRTQMQCDAINEKLGGAQAVLELLSNRALTGFTAPKILWLREHEPKNFEKLRKVLLPKDYVRLQLTGEVATDVSDASGTLLLDIRKRHWSKTVLQKLELDSEILPDLFESSEVAGTLSSQAADLLGLKVGIPVVAGAGDQPAGAVGMGVVKPGVVSATLGTSGVVFAHCEEPEPNRNGLFQSFCHAVPNRWCAFGCMLSAAGALDWFKNKIWPEASFEEILNEASKVAPGSGGLIFLPYLDGERCPHADPLARACFVGLSRVHDRAFMARAVIEGVTFGMADQIELFRQAGIDVTRVKSAGGGAKSLFWRKLQAQIYGAEIITAPTDNASAYGAALLAGVGVNIWNTVEEAYASQEMSRQEHICRPTKDLTAFYKGRHALYQNLYFALKASFALL